RVVRDDGGRARRRDAVRIEREAAFARVRALQRGAVETGAEALRLQPEAGAVVDDVHGRPAGRRRAIERKRHRRPWWSRRTRGSRWACRSRRARRTGRTLGAGGTLRTGGALWARRSLRPRVAAERVERVWRGADRLARRQRREIARATRARA